MNFINEFAPSDNAVIFEQLKKVLEDSNVIPTHGMVKLQISANSTTQSISLTLKLEPKKQIVTYSSWPEK